MARRPDRRIFDTTAQPCRSQVAAPLVFFSFSSLLRYPQAHPPPASSQLPPCTCDTYARLQQSQALLRGRLRRRRRPHRPPPSRRTPLARRAPQLLVGAGGFAFLDIPPIPVLCVPAAADVWGICSHVPLPCCRDGHGDPTKGCRAVTPTSFSCLPVLLVRGRGRGGGGGGGGGGQGVTPTWHRADMPVAGWGVDMSPITPTCATTLVSRCSTNRRQCRASMAAPCQRWRFLLWPATRAMSSTSR